MVLLIYMKFWCVLLYVSRNDSGENENENENEGDNDVKKWRKEGDLKRVVKI